MSLGPVIGSILYQIGGTDAPFLTFFVICILIGISLRFLVPASVDAFEDEEVEESEDRISYLTLLSNKRILFANL